LQQIFDEYPPEAIKKAHGVVVPLRAHSFKDSLLEGDDVDAQLIAEYLHLLGMLNYMTRSRPDLCAAEDLLDIVNYLWSKR
jgi:hypothetical protein